MSRPIITAEGLSKAYRIGVKRDKSATLTAAALRMLKAPVENLRKLGQLNTYDIEDDAEDVYWALKDVSFDIEEGEVVGVIGRNGAGKSTLLKLLSRITDPTRGRAVLRGRVSSLLEVGTGFHPELTGRENVYMNGTILGMRKREVERKFDEIVEFSGVEKFLDTPIKRYSSGMTVRLAFAVAAHLEPEILIIDEVLAVGDAEFQKKCLGKMKDVAKGGRTVLFVSHNMGAVRNLCSTSILLRGGRVAIHGSTATVIAGHLTYERDFSPSFRQTSDDPERTFVEALDVIQHSDVSGAVRIDHPFAITCRLRGPRSKASTLGFVISDAEYQTVCHVSDEFAENIVQVRDGSARSFEIPPYLLNTGTYYISVYLGERQRELHDVAEHCARFEVIWAGPMAEHTAEDAWKGASGPGIGRWSTAS